MLLPSDAEGPNILELMGIVCDHSWHQLQDHTTPSEADETEIRRQMAQKVLAAVVEGERDPRQLMFVALNSIHG
jgi:hypothetical protein